MNEEWKIKLLMESPNIQIKTCIFQSEYLMTIFSAFYTSINSYPNGDHNLINHRNHGFSYREMGGKCGKMRPQKIKKHDAPKNILLSKLTFSIIIVVKKIFPNNDEEGSDNESIQY